MTKIKKEWKPQTGCPYPKGVSRNQTGINIAFPFLGKDCGIILYNAKREKLQRIDLSDADRMGQLVFACVPWEGHEKLLYQLYDKGQVIEDPYMKAYEGHERFGVKVEPEELFGKLSFEEFDWEDDRCPRLPYSDCILYCMHVRGFTRHSSSGVAHRGTFEGVKGKIPYLKELGITTLELMPVYELWERQDTGLNYWGYQKGLYYVPRNSFAASHQGDRELKELIRELHRNGMELVLQFYFPNSVHQSEILSVLKYWKWEYHVDGFHLKGERIPLLMLEQEEEFADTKLFYYDFPVDETGTVKQNGLRNLASYKDEYMYLMRRFLKGDSDMLPQVLKAMRHQPPEQGQINYFSNYYGFTLADMVSYERKHNEANGEENRDGNDYNHTWNCGVEGKSRKKAVISLREKQLRNALCMLFFSQGTPLLFMGDEFENSQNGNNNPYGQDNEISWLDWNNCVKHEELLTYVKTLIRLRREHPILHLESELRLMDYRSCGYPDLSYHADKAWQPDLNNYSRHVGMMYCGQYAKEQGESPDTFFYVAINMHWETHTFALPKLPKGLKWNLLTDTREWKFYEEQKVLPDQQIREVMPRSIQIYISRKEAGSKETGR